MSKKEMCIRDSLHDRTGRAVSAGCCYAQRSRGCPWVVLSHIEGGAGSHQPVSYTHLDVYKRQA